MPPVPSEERARRIQRFKRRFRASALESVNLAAVISTYMYDQTRRGALKRIILALLYRTHFDVVSTGQGRRDQLLILYSGRHRHRRDHDYMVNWLREAANSVSAVRYVEATERFTARQFLPVVLGAWGHRRSAMAFEGGVLDRFSIAVLFSKYSRLIRSSLSPLVDEDRTVLTFCDAHPLDNALAQLARLRGLQTITVQHGQYRALDDANMSADAEAYENFVSDKMMCWGRATVAEFARCGIDERRAEITGWIREWPIEHEDNKSKSRVFGVMLNGENGKQSNQRLLQAANQVASALEWQYIVRLHPMNVASDYYGTISERCSGVREMGLMQYSGQVQFSLAHMTGATVELLRSGSPVYLVDDGRLAEVFRLTGLSYESTEDMIAAIKSSLAEPSASHDNALELYRWFNDDAEQITRVRELITRVWSERAPII